MSRDLALRAVCPEEMRHGQDCLVRTKEGLWLMCNAVHREHGSTIFQDSHSYYRLYGADDLVGVWALPGDREMAEAWLTSRHNQGG